jgi:hypothetical protein
MFTSYLQVRRDIGLRKAIANLILEPANPFDTRARRQPKTVALIATAALVSLAGCFAYFNLLH